jgi:hypothetical protein
VYADPYIGPSCKSYSQVIPVVLTDHISHSETESERWKRYRVRKNSSSSRGAALETASQQIRTIVDKDE